MDYSQFIPNMIEIMEKYWRLFLLEGLKNTPILTCISVAMATILGAGVALLRMSKFKILRFLSSPIPGILQARTLEWVAISFSNA